MKPAIIPRDPDLIKDILMKDFNQFHENDANLSRKHDPLIARNPFFSVGDEWREGRKQILPAFSSSKVCCLLSFLEHQL